MRKLSGKFFFLTDKERMILLNLLNAAVDSDWFEDKLPNGVDSIKEANKISKQLQKDLSKK